MADMKKESKTPKQSFSMMVKEEACEQISSRLHCQIAELAAIIGLCGTVETGKNGRKKIKLQTENGIIAKKCFTLLKKAFSIESVACLVSQGTFHKENRVYMLAIYDPKDVERILAALRLEEAAIRDKDYVVDPVLVQSECCKRAFLRGCFLAVGSVTDPQKSYHMEFICTTSGQANQVLGILGTFGVEAHSVERKKSKGRVSYVVYIKEGDGISDILNIFKTHVALLDLENVRVKKDIANSVNRIVNCETANLQKTIRASSGQIEDILFLDEMIGLDNLPEELRDIARVRLEHDDLPLKDLGQLVEPAIGKSGVNHRLRKIKSLADQLRSEKELQ